MKTFALALFLALVAFPLEADIGCVADGSPEFQSGSESFCALGVFERIHTDFKSEADPVKFFSYMTLNDTGLKMWDKTPKPFFDMIGPIVFKMASSGWDAKVEFRHGGDVLGACWVDFKQEKVLCRVDNGLTS